MYFYKENKMGPKIFKKKYVVPILMFSHLIYFITYDIDESIKQDVHKFCNDNKIKIVLRNDL